MLFNFKFNCWINHLNEQLWMCQSMCYSAPSDLNKSLIITIIAEKITSFIASLLVDRRTLFNTIFVSSHMYPETPERTQVIVGSLNMGYDIIISDTARNRTHNLLRPKCSPISLGHSDKCHFHSWINCCLLDRQLNVPK